MLFLKSNDSINDQINDNGPNAALRAKYGIRYADWQQAHPNVPYTPAFFNAVIAKSWTDFVTDSRTKPMIVKAAAKCRIHPLVDVLEEGAILNVEDRRNAKMAALFTTDEQDSETLRMFTEQEVADAEVCIVLCFNLL